MLPVIAYARFRARQDCGWRCEYAERTGRPPRRAALRRAAFSPARARTSPNAGRAVRRHLGVHEHQRVRMTLVDEDRDLSIALQLETTLRPIVDDRRIRCHVSTSIAPADALLTSDGQWFRSGRSSGDGGRSRTSPPSSIGQPRQADRARARRSKKRTGGLCTAHPMSRNPATPREMHQNAAARESKIALAVCARDRRCLDHAAATARIRRVGR